MFAGYSIEAITNGVHAATWVSEPFRDLFNRHIPGWQQDNFSLRHAISLPRAEVWGAHLTAKRRLLEWVNGKTGAGMDENILTIGFARWASTYKRADLLFHDLELGGMMTAGVDLWLNNPEPPLEASGTSGMKASLNGVPNLSVLDGWWIEGHIEGLTGWAIGETERGEGVNHSRSSDAASLYDKLKHVVLPLFYRDRERFIEVMVYAAAINGSFFNTHANGGNIPKDLLD